MGEAIAAIGGQLKHPWQGGQAGPGVLVRSGSGSKADMASDRSAHQD